MSSQHRSRWETSVAFARKHGKRGRDRRRTGEKKWEAEEDDEGTTFYVNTETRTTVWDAPPCVWDELVDEDSGKTFYHNTLTGDTSWEVPAGFADLKKSAGLLRSQSSTGSTRRSILPIGEIPNDAAQLGKRVSAALNPTAHRRKVIQTRNYFDEDTEKLSMEVHVKSSDTRKLLLKAVESHYIFGELEGDGISKMVDVMECVPFDKKESIITAGEEGDRFYIIEKGTCAVYVPDESSGMKEVAKLGPGESFGELALMYDSPRAATIKAESECSLWAVDRRKFRHIVAHTSVNELKHRCEFLARTPLLSKLSRAELNKVASVLIPKDWEEDSVIVQQGDHGDRFYIVESGECEVLLGIDGQAPEVVGKLAVSY